MLYICETDYYPLPGLTEFPFLNDSGENERPDADNIPTTSLELVV